MVSLRSHSVRRGTGEGVRHLQRDNLALGRGDAIGEDGRFDHDLAALYFLHLTPDLEFRAKRGGLEIAYVQ